MSYCCVYFPRSKTLTHHNLKVIDVSDCNQDRPGTHGFPQLVQAKLSRNRIQKLPNGVFSRNNKLEHILLDGNFITQIENKSFIHMPKLQTLDLSINNLNDIQWFAFRDLMNLKLLNLSNNDLYDIEMTVYADVIDISYNNLYDFEQIKFKMYPNVRNLQLSYNRFRKFPVGNGSDTLKILNLKHNQIEKIDKNSFNNFPSLEAIDLSGNFK